jgi:hypothetical protein
MPGFPVPYENAEIARFRFGFSELLVVGHVPPPLRPRHPTPSHAAAAGRMTTLREVRRAGPHAHRWAGPSSSRPLPLLDRTIRQTSTMPKMYDDPSREGGCESAPHPRTVRLSRSGLCPRCMTTPPGRVAPDLRLDPVDFLTARHVEAGVIQCAPAPTFGPVEILTDWRPR